MGVRRAIDGINNLFSINFDMMNENWFDFVEQKGILRAVSTEKWFALRISEKC